MANVMKAGFNSQMLARNSLKEAEAAAYSEYNKTATKADIILLMQELIKLRSMIAKEEK